jgi:uncharacterized protein YndB with AHSA1/START domain
MIDTSTIPATGTDFRMLVKARVLATDRSTAWSDWASSDGIARWWGPAGSMVDLRIGGPFELWFSLDAPEGQRGSEGCRYLAYVPDEMLAFTWNAPPHLTLRTTNTWVVLTFADHGDSGTAIRLIHAGFLEGDDWDAYRDYFDEAWDSVLDLQQAHHAESDDQEPGDQEPDDN